MTPRGPRPTTKCWTSGCARPFSEHGPNGECPGNPSKRFRRHEQPNNHASVSFSPAELEVLEFMMSGLLRGGDIRRAAKSPAFGGIVTKVDAMKKSIAARKTS